MKQISKPEKVELPPTDSLESEEELRKIAYGILQREEKLEGFNYGDYLKLLRKQEEIMKDPEARTTSVEEVVTDLVRFGGAGADLLARTFLANTTENSRKAYVAGRDRKVLYFCSGNHIHSNKLELALTSCHVPGSSSGGGWGFDGIRRLAIADNWYNNEKEEDPESWMERTRAFVYERSNGELEYKVVPGSRDNEAAKTILYVAVESTKANERAIDRMWAD
jgi:hypothetical protein